MPSALWWTFGALIAFLGWLDVFFTVLHYESRGILTIRLYQAFWWVGRTSFTIFPGRLRQMGLSLISPAMVALTVVIWLAFEILGFALLFMPSMLHGGFHLEQLRPGLSTAIYFSLGNLTSLSFSDVEPRLLGDHLMAATETVIGLGLLTLAIAYIANLYRAIQDQSILATRLYQRTCGTGDGRQIVAAHFVKGEVVDLGSELGEMHASLVSQYESLRRYPVVYYFHTRLPYRSIPYVFGVIATVIAALYFALREDHPAASDPWLRGLATAFDNIVGGMEREFLRRKLPDPPRPLALEQFRQQMSGRATDDDAQRFLDLVRFMRRVSHSPQEPAEAIYSRYQKWLPFHRRATDFVSASAAHLGLERGQLWEEPSEPLY